MRYFISDLHLDESRPKVAEGFLRYLSDLRSQDQLYILGDLFEVWVGDDYETPFIKLMEQSLLNCEAETFIMHGNRDFLIGPAFAERTGTHLLEDPTLIELGGQPVLLMHGDSLCTRDEPYMAVREQLRNPAFQAQLLAQPIEARLVIASGAREKSTAHKANTDLFIMDVTPEAVFDTMKAHEVTTLIHGHTHRPFDHQRQGPDQAYRRLVLGDWHDQGWQISADDKGQLSLSSFML